MDKRGLSSSSRFWGAEGLSRGCSHILAGATLLHTWLGLEDCLPWCLTPTADTPVPVVGRRPHFLYMRASPHEFPHEMASDFPHRERTKRARWKVQDLVWSRLWRHTPTHTQTFWWSHRQSKFNKGRATQRHGSQEVRVVEGHFGWWLWDSNSHEEEKSLSPLLDSGLTLKLALTSRIWGKWCCQHPAPSNQVSFGCSHPLGVLLPCEQPGLASLRMREQEEGGTCPWHTGRGLRYTSESSQQHVQWRQAVLAEPNSNAKSKSCE